MTTTHPAVLPTLNEREVFLGTRHGRRVHLGYRGSSVTNCGVWNRADSVYFEVDPATVRPEHLCASCFPHHGTPMPKAAPAVVAERRANVAAERAAKKAEKAAKAYARDETLAHKVDALLGNYTTRREAFDAWCQSVGGANASTIVLDVWTKRDPHPTRTA